MATLIMRLVRPMPRLHQKNCWPAIAEGWRRSRLRRARRQALRDLADDSHLLADIGVTREEALEGAGKSVFELTHPHIHSL